MGFTTLIVPLLKREGGYVNDPSDSGGETNYGITSRVARANGYRGLIRDMTKSDAMQIYRKRYWNPIEGDALYKLSPMIAEEVFDTAVNMGVGRASEFLQRAVNVLLTTRLLSVDGDIGPATIAGLQRALNQGNGEAVIFKILNSLQGSFYVQLAERRVKDKRFIKGWFNHRIA